MLSKKSTLSFALGALGSAAGIAIVLPAQAAGNPFSAQPLASGYWVAEAKMPEGKCGEGKCGGKMKAPAKTDTKKDAKAASKAVDKKMAEGKCGEGKCGSKMKAGTKETAPDNK